MKLAMPKASSAELLNALRNRPIWLLGWALRRDEELRLRRETDLLLRVMLRKIKDCRRTGCVGPVHCRTP